MNKVSWQKELLLNHEMIDSQHQMLVILLQKLEIAFQQDLPLTAIISICLEVKKFTDFHFLCEENVMRQLNYPRLKEHAQIHSHLLLELELTIHKVNHQLATPEQLLQTLYQWVANHVLTEDRELSNYIHSSSGSLISEQKFGLYTLPPQPQNKKPHSDTR